jgi:dihydropteroate synthase
VTTAIMGGADIVRVHDVRFMMRVAKVTDRMARTSG